MGLVALEVDGEAQIFPLAGSTLLGRGAHCTWPISARDMPSTWLELRWFPAGWAWRCLQRVELTVGRARRHPGLPPDWSRLQAGDTLTLGQTRIRLVDHAPPERFVVAPRTGRWLDGEALDSLLVDLEDGPRPADYETRPDDSGPLEDGGIFVLDGEPWRFHAGQPPPLTDGARLDLGSPRTTVLLDTSGPRPRLVVEGPTEQVEICSTCLWALVPYARAARDQVPAHGWLDLESAWQEWRDCTRSDTTRRDRVTQDRHRICRTLAAAGVGQAELLFQTRRTAAGWETRLGLAPEQVRYLVN